ncbi:homocysteine S-methyltransferase family protein [Acetobacteraceae bacterium H6797]|nr:homocysteine S-methyltransferase family protein [Acetobacteraceae bacterium H6797]
MMTTILDGGMGRLLARMGAPFKQPEWSALALMEAPETVLEAHRQYIAAGAGVITTNAYAVVPFHVGEEVFARDGARLIGLAARLARQAADEVPGTVVAGSLPPLFGSYRPDLFDAARAPDLLKVLVEEQAPYVDLFLAETTSSIAEATAAATAMKATGKPLWVSFTIEDDDPARPTAKLRSGEPVAEAALAMKALGAEAVLFNCSQPEVMGAAIDAATAALAGSGIRVGVYANAFPPRGGGSEANAGLSRLRVDLGEEAYCACAIDWRRRGASIIGGCCGIFPEQIAAVKKAIG